MFFLHWLRDSLFKNIRIFLSTTQIEKRNPVAVLASSAPPPRAPQLCPVYVQCHQEPGRKGVIY